MTEPHTITPAGGDLTAAVADDGFRRCPYPTYRKFVANPGWRTPAGYRVFGGHEDVLRILREPAVFGQEGIPYPNFHVLDPPDHTRLRKLVARPFTQRAVNRQEEQIAGIVDELIDGVYARGHMDLMTEFALVLPARVAAIMFDVPIEDVEQWNRWLWDIGRFRGKVWYLEEGPQSEKDAAAAAAAAGAAYFKGLMAERRSRPGDDIVSGLLDAREGDDRLTEEEVLFSLVLILGGGLHTTASQTGNMVRAMLEHPGELAKLVADPGLVEGAVDEALRFDPALQAEYRVAREHAVVGDVAVEAGTPVIVVNAAANRDPEMFPQPDTFDIVRPNAASHITFGSGIHRCLGAQLARTELVIALRQLTARLPGLRLAGAPVQHQYDRWRGLSSLPVAWDVTT